MGFKKQVRSWTIKRSSENAKINWQFKMQDVVLIEKYKTYISIPYTYFATDFVGEDLLSQVFIPQYFRLNDE